VTYVSYILFTALKYSSTPVDVIALLSSWNHWDAANYTRIAQFGYQQLNDYAFFPLFPLLIAGISTLLGSWSYFFVGFLISNGALLGVLFLLYGFAKEAAGDAVARRTILYLCTFPTAFFFFTAYNESLFLLFVLGAFLAMRQHCWLLAGLLGFFATFTRSAGVLLILPYLYELWQERENICSSFSRVLYSLLSLSFIPLGIIVYIIYSYMAIGNPFAFITAQSGFGRHLSWPWQGLWQGVTACITQPFGSANQVHLLLDLSATIGFVILAVLGWRRLRRSYSIWIAILLLYILLDPAMDKPDILLSNQRFVLEMFPGFITLGILSIQHPRLHQTLLVLFPTLLATLSTLFILNRWLV
jgi:hypothetical protein